MLSLGVHGLFAVAVMYAPLGGLLDGARASEPVAIEIVTDPALEPARSEPERAEPPEVAPEEEPPPEPEEAVEEPPEQAAAAIVRPPTSVEPTIEPDPSAEPGSGDPASSDEAETAAGTIELPEVTPDRAPSRSPEELRALLAPGSVARRSFRATGPGPSQPGPPAGTGDGRGDTGPSEEEIERRLQEGLRADALTKNHTTRETIEPQRQADGSYQWSGHAFTATINPDGSVEFEDRGNVQTDGFSSSGSWDLTDAIMGSQGQDPYRAERERFMRQTRELRERLESEYRRQNMESGLRRLRGRLRRIWRTTSRSHRARRERIFRIWDDIAEDSSGTEARAIVMRFIRETLPEGSEHAYTDQEVERFNAARQSRERFDPY